MFFNFWRLALRDLLTEIPTDLADLLENVRAISVLLIQIFVLEELINIIERSGKTAYSKLLSFVAQSKRLQSVLGKLNQPAARLPLLSPEFGAW